MGHLLYSLISLIIALFFVMLGLIAMILPWSVEARTDLVQFILEGSISLFLFGFVFMAIGLGIVIQIVLAAKKQYYHVRSGSNPVWVDESIIQDYLDNYWKRIFPRSSIPSKLQLKKNKIHVTADLPFIPHGEQKELLEKIKKDIQELLSKILGYQQPFYLSATFETERKKST